ncbi:MAG: sigma-54-dependent Fis family transcriptional regulator [Bradymonadales bacterium]|nr:MAG: sigma-54-dependent Fis family transcriptional regulator [Bradymonadales bacterium]
MAKILIVDDEENVRKILGIQLRRLGHETVEAPDGPEALDFLKEQAFQTVITDLKMPKMDGLELLQRIRKNYPQIPVVMITAHGTIDTAVEAMKRGAFDYVTKPFQPEEFLEIIDRAVRSAEELSKEFQRSRSFLRQEDKIIGSTSEVEKVYGIIERVANNNSNILITGETGTGKEVVVRLLHDKSIRKDQPMVRAYISSTSGEQQSAHLFGESKRPGCFDLAAGGSLYIDEVSLLSLQTQAELHEALTSGKYNSPSGPAAVDCRIIAATDYNLLDKIERGEFRKDLFYCLNVVPIHLPPLRDRTQDIEPLVDHFIQVFSKKFQKRLSHMDDDALFLLIQYPWPGNLRELENCLEFAVNVSDGPVIKVDHLPPHLKTTQAAELRQERSSRDVLESKVQGLEKVAIEEALQSSGGDLLKASQKLGVPPSLLEKKLALLQVLPSR